MDQYNRSFQDPEQSDVSLSLWYYDGTVVFQAGGVVFRVYAGVLATKSPVLDKLLNPYREPEHPESYDNVRLIHLPHSPLDLYYFLTAFYDSSTFFEGPLWSRFSAVSALLRLGTHYRIEHFREKAIAWLTTTYPNTLSQHATRRRIQPAQNIQAYALIRDISVTQCLASVSYACAVFCGPSLVLSSSLTETEKHTLLQAYQVLIDAQLALFRAVTFNSGDLPPENSGLATCQSPGRCNLGRLTALSPKLLIFPENFDPLAPCFPNLTWEEYADMTCERCCSRARMMYDKKRTTLWRRLPEVFQLPEWSEIDGREKEDKGDVFNRITAMIFRKQRRGA